MTLSLILPILFVVVLLALCVLGAAGLLSEERARVLYKRRGPVLTAAEQRFDVALRASIGDSSMLLPKVRIADLVQTVAGLDASTRTTAFNRISAKHFDWTLVRKSDFMPIAVIELDDSSHQRRDRQERDRFVDEVCRQAEIPILHYPARREYDPKAVRQALASVINPASSSEGSQESPAVSDAAPEPAHTDGPVTHNHAPDCPRCGEPMIWRNSKKAGGAGSDFWGCQSFPRCRGNRPATAG